MWKSPIVSLCVGGETFKTRLETIRSKGGLLASLFEGDWKSKLDSVGVFFSFRIFSEIYRNVVQFRLQKNEFLALRSDLARV